MYKDHSKNYKKILVCLISIILAGCVSAPEKSVNIVVNPNVPMAAGDFIEACKEIRLSNSDSCLISNIKGVRMSDDYIALLSSGQIFLFDSSGIFLRRIGGVGHGRGEYISVSDFHLYEDKVLVLSTYQNALLEYAVDGTYVRTHVLDDKYHRFQVLDGRSVVFASENSNDTHSNFVWYDLTTDKVSGSSAYFKNNESLVLSEFNAFVGKKEHLFVCSPFDYTVYSLKGVGQEPEAVVVFDFQTSERLPQDKETRSYMELDECSQNRNVVRYLSAYSEVGNALYLVYPLFGNYGIRTRITRIEESGDNRTCEIGMEIDSTFHYFCLGRYQGLYDNNIVMVGEADALLMFEKGNGYTHFSSSGLKEGDNPILFLYKLKP